MRYFTTQNDGKEIDIYPYWEDEEWDRQEAEAEKELARQSLQIKREADYRDGWLPIRKL